MENQDHRTTSRILDIIELVAGDEGGKTFSEISRALAMPKGSLHPLLQTLCRRRYLRFAPESQRYFVGEMLFAAGSRYVEDASILQRVRDELYRLSQATRETSYFGVLSGTEVLYLLKANSPALLQMASRPGDRTRAYCTSIGKALLSGFSDGEVRALYSAGLHAVTPATVTDMDELCRQLAQVRQTGFAYERGESSPQAQCVATPVFLNGRLVAAISCAFPSFLCEEEKYASVRNALAEARARIEAVLAADPSRWIYS